MDVRHATAPDRIPGRVTEWLRGRFLAEGRFEPGEARSVHSYGDRTVIGGALPGGTGDSRVTRGGGALRDG